MKLKLNLMAKLKKLKLKLNSSELKGKSGAPVLRVLHSLSIAGAHITLSARILWAFVDETDVISSGTGFPCFYTLAQVLSSDDQHVAPRSAVY